MARSSRIQQAVSVQNAREAAQPASLDHLPGMPEAIVFWAKALMDDLEEYRAGRLSWRDIDKGCVFAGPPGTGKTTLARAIAKLCGVPFISTSYGDWQRHGTGNLGDVLRAMLEKFEEARENVPSILFIDEIDSIPGRNNSASSRNDDWYVEINNSLLDCLDGSFNREGVVVIGATNRVEKLDPALVRSGRLDRIFSIGLPDAAALESIFRVHLRNDLRADADDVSALAIGAVGLSGADVEQICRQARRTARVAKRPMTIGDVEAELFRQSDSETQEQKQTYAVHEAGHALVALRSGIAQTVSMSLVADRNREGSTAVTFLPGVQNLAAIEARIAVSLGGRAAEEVVFGTVTAGSGGGDGCDLAHATHLACSAVCALGLSKAQPLLWMPAMRLEQIFLGFPALGEEVQELLDRGYAQSLAILKENEAALYELANLLLEKRALGDLEIRAVVSRAAGAPTFTH